MRKWREKWWFAPRKWQLVRFDGIGGERALRRFERLSGPQTPAFVEIYGFLHPKGLFFLPIKALPHLQMACLFQEKLNQYLK